MGPTHHHLPSPPVHLQLLADPRRPFRAELEDVVVHQDPGDQVTRWETNVVDCEHVEAWVRGGVSRR